MQQQSKSDIEHEHVEWNQPASEQDAKTRPPPMAMLKKTLPGP